MASVKKDIRWPRNGCDSISWWQNFNTNNSGEFCIGIHTGNFLTGSHLFLQLGCFCVDNTSFCNLLCILFFFYSPQLNYIKTHGGVSCGPRNGACAHYVSLLTQRTKYNFTRIRSFVVSWPNKTKFTVQVPAYRERTHARSEVNRASRSWNISLQKVAHFLSFFFFFRSSFRTLAKKLQ